jgi:hypothetical protein
VTVDSLSMADGRITRWQARAVVVALPVFIARRVIDPLPPVVAARASGLPLAPWAVVNLRLDDAPKDRGARRCWRNPGPTGATARWPSCRCRTRTCRRWCARWR